MLLSHEVLPQDAHTKYTLYTMPKYVRVLVSQLAAIIQISYLKIGDSPSVLALYFYSVAPPPKCW